MSGQTIVQYGAVTLYQCSTRFEQVPVFDASGTDLKSLRTVVHVNGYLIGHTGDKLHSPTYSGGAAGQHKGVRYQLPPREEFTVTTGCTTTSPASGVTLFYARAFPDTVTIPSNLGSNGLTGYDVSDGPRCLGFYVTHVYSNEVFRVEAIFEIHKVECDANGAATGNRNGVLSHRWSSNDQLDTNLRTVRTYTGTLELATATFSPHWFRSLVVPPLGDGFRRDSMRFVASEDGKRLQYAITDTEIAISAPYPATRWSVNYSEGAHTGQKGFGTLDISLEGDSNVNKRDLISIAMKVIDNKLKRLDPTTMRAANSYLLEDILVTDHIGDVNAISVHASMSRTATQNATNFAQISAGMLGTVIPAADLPEFAATYDPRQSRGGRDGERPEYKGPTDLIGIWRCYLQKPCDMDHGIRSTYGPNNMVDSDVNTPTVANPRSTISAVVVPEITIEYPSHYSDSHKEAMYRIFKCESLIKTNMLRAVMPKALSAWVAPEGTPDAVDNRSSVSVVSLGVGMVTMIVRMVAERVGAEPELPDPDNLYLGVATYSPDYSPGDVTTSAPISMTHLGTKLLAGTRSYSAGGQTLYRARAEMRFALDRRPRPDEVLKIGNNPWTSTGVEVTSGTLTNSDWGDYTPPEVIP